MADDFTLDTYFSEKPLDPPLWETRGEYADTGKKGKLIKDANTGKLIRCDNCPCDVTDTTITLTRRARSFGYIWGYPQGHENWDEITGAYSCDAYLFRMEYWTGNKKSASELFGYGSISCELAWAYYCTPLFYPSDQQVAEVELMNEEYNELVEKALTDAIKLSRSQPWLLLEEITWDTAPGSPLTADAGVVREKDGSITITAWAATGGNYSLYFNNSCPGHKCADIQIGKPPADPEEKKLRYILEITWARFKTDLRGNHGDITSKDFINKGSLDPVIINQGDTITRNDVLAACFPPEWTDPEPKIYTCYEDCADYGDLGSACVSFPWNNVAWEFNQRYPWQGTGEVVDINIVIKRAEVNAPGLDAIILAHIERFCLDSEEEREDNPDRGCSNCHENRELLHCPRVKVEVERTDDDVIEVNTFRVPPTNSGYRPYRWVKFTRSVHSDKIIIPPQLFELDHTPGPVLKHERDLIGKDSDKLCSMNEFFLSEKQKL